jgi:hypothetical protein
MRSAAVLGLMTAVLFPLPAQGCGESTAPEAVVQAQVDAYNAHDIERFVQCYADDITIHDLSGQDPPTKGIAELRKEYQWLAKAPPEYRVQIINRLTVGRIVVDVERVLGLPKEKGTPEVIAVFEVRDGKIRNVWFPPSE